MMIELIKKNFDYQYYIEKYPDIKENCKTNEDCIWHFCGLKDLNNVDKILNGDGMKEKRLFNKKLEELENYGYDKYIIDNLILKNEKIIDVQLHFLENYNNFIQKLEKLKLELIKKNFEYEYYIEKYPDIKENYKTYEDCIWHFCGVKDVNDDDKILNGDGMKEKRLFNKKLEKLENYGYDKYIIDNLILKNKKIIDVQLHFIQKLEKLELEKLELEKLKLEKLKQEKLEQEKLELEKLKLEKFKQEKLRLEKLRLEKLKQEKLKQEKLKLEKLKEERRLFNTKKVLIIYVYYQRVNETKNQTNLSFFIKYGLNNSLWNTNYDITTVFVINNDKCEVLIPNNENIDVLKIKEDNYSDWEGWYDGIKFIENKYKQPIYNKYDYLCLINCSCFGPVFENNIDKHWFDPFIDKLNEEKSVICCPCKNLLPIEDLGGPGFRVSPIFSLIKIDKNVINLLINTKIYSYNDDIKDGWYNTVLSKKKNKIDAALTGEYGLSKILLKNNYKISSLLTGNNNYRIDFYNNNTNNILKNTIFIKNVWRWEGNYASQPVLYKYCTDFLNLKLNYKNEFNEYEDKIYNFNSIKNENNKMIISYNLPINEGPTTNWNSKEDFYNKFYYAEEPIIFPKISKNNKNCVIYAHYDSDNIIKDYVNISLKILILLNYDIIFYTSSSNLNIDKNIYPFKINYINNIGAGTDWLIWLDGLKKLSKYDNILLVNDSLLLGINGIENMRKSINNLREKSEIWGHWSSNEHQYHYIGSPIEIKQKVRLELINFLDENILLCKDKNDFILNIETKLIQHLKSKNYKTGVLFEEDDICFKVKDYKNKYFCCISHNPFLLKYWLNNTNAFAVKWKYTLPYLLFNNITSPFLNFQLKYLHTSEYNLFINEAERHGSFPKQNQFKKFNWFNNHDEYIKWN